MKSIHEIMANAFGLKPKAHMLDTNEIAQLVGSSPETLAAFERAYSKVETDESARHAIQASEKPKYSLVADLNETIVNDLVAQTATYVYDGEHGSFHDTTATPADASDVSNKDLAQLPKSARPQLTGNACVCDISNEDTAPTLLWHLKMWQETGNITYYHRFRQGLDILDLDPLAYLMLGRNANSMGNWLPQLVDANIAAKRPFLVPRTTVAKVPLTLLQLTRIEFASLTPATKAIVNEWAMRIFDLDDTKDAFVKTGTYSSKFDFRNAHVPAGQEIHELGEYLIYIQNTAVNMAGPLTQPSIYGMSTTNEFAVREYIKPVDDDPCIYHGLPLRTEYRVFVDCDADEVLGIHNYWDPEVMAKRFAERRGIDDVHDAVTYEANRKRLCARYESHKNDVAARIGKLLPHLNLRGQWSIDVMQNGNDLWLIDMATADHSAFYEETVPASKRVASTEDWIPKLEA